MQTIKILEDDIINKIAAGEIIDRPSSVIKELLENSIDAGASKIIINIEHAGKSLIEIDDNGIGMGIDDLKLSMLRHTTSKLNDINNINTFGFRGEALASIASIARVKIETKNMNYDYGYAITAEDGIIDNPIVCNRRVGTKIIVRDLFFSTPARLNFMKSESTENSNIISVINKIAIAHPNIAFQISITNGKIYKTFSATSYIQRICDVINKDFEQNTVPIEIYKDEYGLTGWISKSSYTKSSFEGILIYINSRPIKDKAIQTIIKIAYGDLVPKDRYPIAVLFLSLPIDEIDVNVHPAKTEVRFKNISIIRDLLFVAIKKALSVERISYIDLPKVDKQPIINSQVSKQQESRIILEHIPEKNIITNTIREKDIDIARNTIIDKPIFYANEGEIIKEPLKYDKTFINKSVQTEMYTQEIIHNFFGNVIGQAHNSYIITQHKDGIIIIDQHAAHERINYEKLKQDFHSKTILRQILSIPIILNIDSITEDIINILYNIGFSIEHKDQEYCLTAVPAILSTPEHICEAIVSYIETINAEDSIKVAIDKILANVACKKSITFGKQLSLNEMETLLKELSSIENFDRCNHGRRVYYKLSKTELLSIFDRK